MHLYILINKYKAKLISEDQSFFSYTKKHCDAKLVRNVIDLIKIHSLHLIFANTIISLSPFFDSQFFFYITDF